MSCSLFFFFLFKPWPLEMVLKHETILLLYYNRLFWWLRILCSQILNIANRLWQNVIKRLNVLNIKVNFFFYVIMFEIWYLGDIHHSFTMDYVNPYFSAHFQSILFLPTHNLLISNVSFSHFSFKIKMPNTF